MIYFNCIYAHIGAYKVDWVEIDDKWGFNMGISRTVLRDGGCSETGPGVVSFVRSKEINGELI